VLPRRICKKSATTCVLMARSRLRHGLQSWSQLRKPRSPRAAIRLEQGNFSTVKSIGQGVFEYRIDFGPGYRVYFGQDGQALVILLTRGTKKRQQRDIEAAHAYWQDYKQSKRGRR
jgi:putative addiction module killer protein